MHYMPRETTGTTSGGLKLQPIAILTYSSCCSCSCCNVVVVVVIL